MPGRARGVRMAVRRTGRAGGPIRRKHPSLRKSRRKRASISDRANETEQSNREIIEKPGSPVRESEEVTETFHRIVAGFATPGSGGHPLYEKIESEHLTKILDHAYDLEKGRQKAGKENRWFGLAYVLIFVAVAAGMTAYFLPAHEELYVEILKLVGAFLAGGFGGYGFKAYQDGRNS